MRRASATMPSQGKYSGVPGTDEEATASPPGSAIPVALPVTGAGAGAGAGLGGGGGGGSEMEQAASPPLATKVETFEVAQGAKRGTAAGAGSFDNEDGDGSGGVRVEWTKGEPQPPAFRDRWFAVAFLANVAAVLATAAALGPAGWAKLTSGSSGAAGGGTRRMDESEDGYDGGGSSGSSSSSGSNPPEGFWLAVASISLVAAPALSIAALSVMSKNAALLIRMSLYFAVANAGFAAFVSLLLGLPLNAIICGILTAILVCYARSVWHRIPYAASNLRAGIEAVRSNLGVSLVAVGAVPVLVAWTVGWSVALLGTMETDWMQTQIEEEDGGRGSTGGDDPEGGISGVGAFVIMLFLLSFYWTHQVIKNVVRTSVAGVVGTWWFTPHEASSFCSSAVLGSFLRATTYSLGSICFGSLIVAVLHLLRNILRSANNERNRSAGGDILRCIAACILLYIERLVEYFNKWAFIYVGLYGYGYVEAGRNVMSLFKARGWTAVISDNLVNRLLSIVSLAIGLMVGVATLLAALMFEEFESKAGWLSSGFFVGFIIGIVLSSIMMGVVSSAVDGIIVCFAEAPAEFKESHPELSAEMESTWAAAWPDLHLGGPVIVSLGGGLGIV